MHKNKLPQVFRFDLFGRREEKYAMKFQKMELRILMPQLLAGFG